MLNIVIPMAGAGSRFAQAGYQDPKPLIPVGQKPMIQLVIENLTPLTDSHRFIFICQRSHVASYGLREKLTSWAPNCEVIEIEGITKGAACTVLQAKSLIDNKDALMIANSDQYVELSIDTYLRHLPQQNLDGLIMTMKASDPKWSYAGLDAKGLVNRVVEKEVISDEATVGIYNFAQGADFVQAAESMIQKGLTVKGEYYVAPAYNLLLQNPAYRVGVLNVGQEGDGMHGLGTPADLDLFLQTKAFEATQS